jgi:uncharacterized protein (TIGR02271 family)
MVNKPPVHVEPRDNDWTVVREGSKRATSVHPTQSEAEKVGRELARRDETEFFLHAQDGRVREHRNYGEEPPGAPPGAPPEDKGLVDQAAQTAGTLVGGVVGAAGAAVGAAGAAVPPAGNDAGQEAHRSGSTSEATPDKEASNEETNDAEEEEEEEEEVNILTEANQDENLETPEERYAGYELYDRDGERIGKPDDLFVDEDDNPEYVGVWTEPSGSRSLLIPAEVVTVEEALTLRRMVVSRPKSVVEAGPSLQRGEELTPDLEERVRRHYGLPCLPGAEGRGGYYGAYYRGATEPAEERGPSGAAVPGAPPIPSSGAGDVGGGEHDRQGLAEPPILEGGEEEELRVRRSEEELKVETREREAGTVRVRKRVRTDRERIVVPKKRVEVTVERVPVVEGEGAGSEIGEEEEEEEIVVPIIEEEVIVEKRPVVREELRIRKEVVEDTEVVEEDVRREEIEVDDQTERNDV